MMTRKDEEQRPYHAVANLFPLLQGEEYEQLKADIAASGLREAIWLHPDGSIIDGRNRHRACLDTGTPLHFRTWDGHGSLVSLVVSLNLHRRHLNSSQRAVIALDVLPLLEEEARERQGHGQTAPGKTLSQRIDQASGRAAEQAAALLNTNRQYVSDAKRLQQEAPQLLEAVRGGDLNIVQAKRQLKEQRREARREDNREQIAAAADPAQLTGVYSAIVIDPPWDWDDEGDVDQLGRARPTYHTLSIDELRALPVGKLADENCHVYLWITNRSLPKGFDLLERWGFRYITCITWVKPSFGMGNYFRGQTEHVLFGVKGSQPLLRKDAATVFQAPRGPDGHSSKPPAFYDFVESCSPGPYLEMFSRGERDGWVTWGEGGINGNRV
jgi:N6-adenosine-specific RNA methylase IME4